MASWRVEKNAMMATVAQEMGAALAAQTAASIAHCKAKRVNQFAATDWSCFQKCAMTGTESVEMAVAETAIGRLDSTACLMGAHAKRSVAMESLSQVKIVTTVTL